MTDRERIEPQIREVLAHEQHAIPLSNKLFSPSGLFNQLATTVAERRVVAQSELFRQAQHRFTELQRKESADFARVVNQIEGTLGEVGCRIKFERVEPQ